eukprot:CAMPEP_0183799584 /NCGR_PEP_ID=MMETSP0803_2-20130417/22101_1 /TAXON_ID=195967 /ORGANISM="Crustomastix stigmata, Strain CCMP3273" /LENGTH=31 /DNA_ID= /DNA_START= /DNA_END= /DNA_ORIENTATION=
MRPPSQWRRAALRAVAVGTAVAAACWARRAR